MNLAVLSNLAINVNPGKHPDKQCQERAKEVNDGVVLGCATKSTPFHEGTKESHSDKVFPVLESLDSLLGNLVGCLLGVVLFDNLCNLGLDLVLALVGLGEDGAGVDDVDLDVLGVHLDLLGDVLGQTSHGVLGGGVGAVSGRGVEGDDARGHDEVLGLLLDGGVGGEPLAEDGVGHFGGAVEVDVHVSSQRLHLHVDE